MAKITGSVEVGDVLVYLPSEELSLWVVVRTEDRNYIIEFVESPEGTARRGAPHTMKASPENLEMFFELVFTRKELVEWITKAGLVK